jgi:hypothetical protein
LWKSTVVTLLAVARKDVEFASKYEENVAYIYVSKRNVGQKKTMNLSLVKSGYLRYWEQQ